MGGNNSVYSKNKLYEIKYSEAVFFLAKDIAAMLVTDLAQMVYRHSDKKRANGEPLFGAKVNLLYES